MVYLGSIPRILISELLPPPVTSTPEHLLAHQLHHDMILFLIVHELQLKTEAGASSTVCLNPEAVVTSNLSGSSAEAVITKLDAKSSNNAKRNFIFSLTLPFPILQEYIFFKFYIDGQIDSCFNNEGN